MADEEGSYQPKTDVSFAPTKAFVKKWGAEEAAKQQKLYNTPSWQEQPAVVEKPQHDEETMEIVKKAVLIGFGGGIALGFSIWLASKYWPKWTPEATTIN